MSDGICDVLNCGRPFAGIVTISSDDPDTVRMEAAACTEHKLAIEAGDRWAPGEGHAILMGIDIAPDMIGWSLSKDIGPGATLTIEAGRASGEKYTLTVWLAPDQAAKLGEALSFEGE